jgi:ParB family transcriptional regulator, chromosome partitioning protein
MMERRSALGKGLSALIPDAPEPVVKSGPLEVDIDLIVPNERQPRLQMDDGKLEDLARSIKANGIIQPILVRSLRRSSDGAKTEDTGATFQIIAGERRWRAAQRAGLLKVPVVIRDMPAGSEKEQLALALIENIQRENLNPVDEAMAYQRLADDHALTQDQIAAAVGKDRSSVANYVRLLKLPDEVRAELAGGALSMGHARAILALPDPAAQRQAAREVISRALSVRETEMLVKRLASNRPHGGGASAPAAPQADVHTRAAEDRMRFALGTKVKIVRRGAGGAIEILFNSETELNRLYEILTATK